MSQDNAVPTRAIVSMPESHPLAKNPDESIDEFLQRLKPSGLKKASKEYISIDNPQVERMSCDFEEYRKEGQEFLDQFKAREEMLEEAEASEDSADNSRIRRTTQLRRKILAVARMAYVIEGKWYLFPSDELIDET